LHPILFIQELQAIKLKQDNSNYINQVKFIKLLHDDCHKQVVLISESRGDSNRCTPCRRKLHQHATWFPHSIHVWHSTIHISCGPHIASFREIIKSDGQSHAPEKRAPDTIHSMPADRPVGPYPVSLPSQPLEQWG
jgi:hypothetical protein